MTPAGRTVLIADDEVDIAAFIAGALEDAGYRYRTAVTPTEALQLAHEEQPALILLDIALPGLNGTEVSRRLRADPATVAIPIIAMSGRHNLDYPSQLRYVDEWLPKPFGFDALYAAVDRWIAAS